MEQRSGLSAAIARAAAKQDMKGMKLICASLSPNDWLGIEFQLAYLLRGPLPFPRNSRLVAGL